tara:strand:+ start:553 stop:2025 length:1473 start_codon:yes stop_codon:yes gene_type:complete
MTIPVNIITGVLGVGKTTAIRHLMSQRPSHERWGIVVNEFGTLGIDGAMLDTAAGLSKTNASDADAEAGGVVVREVAGGCLCCAVAAPFTVAVTQLLRRAKPDRLIIEPSGLGHPGGLHDALQGEHLRKVLRIAATIALVDMTQVALGGALVESEAFRDQVQCADVVVGAKGDVASVNDQCRFTDWAQALYPPKAAVHVIARGELDLAVLDTPLDHDVQLCRPAVVSVSSHGPGAMRRALKNLPGAEDDADDPSAPGSAPSAPPTRGAPNRIVGGTDEFVTCGLWFHRDDVFVRSSLAILFESLANEPNVVRFKGVLRVGKEWVAPNVDADGTVRLDPVAWRRDSRIEVIVKAPGGTVKKVEFDDDTGEKTEKTKDESKEEDAEKKDDEDTEAAGGEEETTETPLDDEGHLEGIEEEDEEGYKTDEGAPDDSRKEEGSPDRGVGVDAAGGAAGRCDWDALQTAITAAVKPDIQSPKKSPNAKRLPGLEDA